MKRVLIATSNAGKLEEYKSYLESAGFKAISLSDEGIDSTAPEKGKSYSEIAENKAQFYSKHTKLPLVAEDSGLEIHALRGFPGVETARWMAGSDEVKNLAIIQKMKGIKYRKAIFKVVLVYLHKKEIVRFQGEMIGEIAEKPQGIMGFGFDQIFYIPEKKRTLAELLLFEKNKISARGQALKKLVSYLKKFSPQ